LLQNPENVNDTHTNDLRQAVERFPYLTSARLLLAKALKKSDSIHFPFVARQTSLYVLDRRWFYFFLFPEKLQQDVDYQPKAQSSGEYFDLIEKIEKQGGDTQQSLRSLAEKLKEARREFSGIDKENIKTEKIAQISEDQQIKDDFYWQEMEREARKLIVEKKFSAALAILREINLNIPKKSIYFADQIRFLEKIIQISNN
jgi:hypothetical protein